jgi:hypothetical protein
MKSIPLNGANGKGRFAIVDDEDYPVISRVTWHLSSHGYATTGKFYLHALLMGFPSNRVVDHINRNPLDNRKHNLRLVTSQHNLMNRGQQRNHKTSPYKGVYRRKHLLKNPWQASIAKTIDGKQKTYVLGYFATAEEAARAYDAKAVELYGEFAFSNF